MHIEIHSELIELSFEEWTEILNKAIAASGYALDGEVVE